MSAFIRSSTRSASFARIRRIDDFLRLRNFRLIDLFRSASINLSLESEGDADGYRLQPEDSLSADEVYALLHSARIRISRASALTFMSCVSLLHCQ